MEALRDEQRLSQDFRVALQNSPEDFSFDRRNTGVGRLRLIQPLQIVAGSLIFSTR